jgi:hypothetical protein
VIRYPGGDLASEVYIRDWVSGTELSDHHGTALSVPKSANCSSIKTLPAHKHQHQQLSAYIHFLQHNVSPSPRTGRAVLHADTDAAPSASASAQARIQGFNLALGFVAVLGAASSGRGKTRWTETHFASM